jgi:GTP-binding protein
LILFIVSAKDGINNDDYYVAKLLKKYKNKDIILVINKAENIKKVDNIYYSLGFKEPILISAEHSIGMGDLLDKIITYDKKKNNIKEESFSFCIIGKTNVGKSTLLNAVVNEERVIVSPIEHTTRDSIDVDFKYNNKNYTIVDTAGIRRKGKIKDDIEKFAIMRTEGAIQRSELIILMLDGSKPFDEQDKIIGGLAYKANIPTIICVNK